MNDGGLALAQLLCTRLCHDLAGPVGAVAAGVELIGDDPAAVDSETLGLIGSSSAAASRKLRFLRAALGLPGGSAGDLKGLLDGYLTATAGPYGAAKVQWPAPAVQHSAAAAFGDLWAPAVLNLFLLALEAMPGSRAVEMDCAAAPASITVTAHATPGRAPALREELRAAVDGTGQTPTPKTIQAHFISQLMRAAGGTVALSASGDAVVATASLPNGLRSSGSGG